MYPLTPNTTRHTASDSHSHNIYSSLKMNMLCPRLSDLLRT